MRDRKNPIDLAKLVKRPNGEWKALLDSLEIDAKSASSTRWGRRFVASGKIARAPQTRFV